MPDKNESVLHLENDNVTFIEMTTTEVRSVDVEANLSSAEMKLTEALDNAQAKAFTGEDDVSYLVIKITRN